MKLFSLAFNLVKLPLVVAKDTFCAIPDSSMLKEPFSDTKNLCAEMDEDLE